MLSDIEIANAAELHPIMKVAQDELGIDPVHLVPYARHKAKVDLSYLQSLEDRPLGKLVLMTALSPTPAGEGKTTTTVGLADALRGGGQDDAHGGAGRRTARAGTQGDGLPARAVDGSGLRHEGRRRGRRLGAG